MTLRDLKIGQFGEVTQVEGNGICRQHLLDMGIIPGTTIKLVKYAPMGDPMEVMVHGYSLTLRLAEAEKISVQRAEPTDSTTNADTTPQNNSPFTHPEARVAESLHEHNSHPGYGEAGIYHDKNHERPLSEDTVLTFALAGQQNCGKTTLFNQLTGSKQHVGNFPGVTVDRKDGEIRGQITPWSLICPACIPYRLILLKKKSHEISF